MTGIFHRVDPSHLAFSFEWEPADEADQETIAELAFRPIDDDRVRLGKVPSRPTHDARFTGTAGRSRLTGLPSSSPASARAADQSGRAAPCRAKQHCCPADPEQP